jgi:hypothetical protein
VLELKVLVLELLAVDGLAARAVPLGEVAALTHEAGNHSVEGRVLVADAFLARAQRAEVFGGFGHLVLAQLHDDPPGLLPANFHVEVHARVCSEHERFIAHASALLRNPRVEVLLVWVLLL